MPFRYVTAADFVVDHAVICVDLGYAVFALENLHTKDKSQDARKQVGNTYLRKGGTINGYD